MKEDKENTRPREKKTDIKCEENEKPDKPSKEKKEAMTKVSKRQQSLYVEASLLTNNVTYVSAMLRSFGFRYYR